MEQLNLFGEEGKRLGRFVVFHDESESSPNKGWLLIGLTFVQAENVPRVREALTWYRQRESYFGEVHFSELPKSFGGAYGGKARVARRWLESYPGGLAGLARCSILAVDRGCSAYDHGRFGEDFHAYNRFTAMALKAGIAWFLSGDVWDQVEIELVSDAKTRKSRPDQGFTDNFEDYVPKRAGLDNYVSRVVEGKARPQVHVGPVSLLDSGTDDLLQLTDVLLGGSKVALAGGTTRETKRTLGSMVASWHRDCQRPAWEQQYKLGRQFNLWGFPDESGRAYNRTPLAVGDEAGALLFES